MLKQRIQTMWMPGFAAVILALAVSIAVNRVASSVFAEPHRGIIVYSSWLLILAGIGAFAAGWSRFAGGSVANRAVAAFFPATTICAALGSLVTNPELKMAVIAFVFSPSEVRISPILPVIANSVVGGILLPAVALLAGALPFLRGNGVSPPNFHGSIFAKHCTNGRTEATRIAIKRGLVSPSDLPRLE